MNRRFRGFGVYFVLLILGAALLFWVSKNAQDARVMTQEEYQEALEGNNIKEATIKQNEAVPTGVMIIKMKDDKVKEINVSDVNEAQEELKDNGVKNIKLDNVPKENWFVTTLLPLLVIFGLTLFLFSMMNRQANGGGGAKMMNFGKSRAKLHTVENMKVTFKEVAGLDEEKEELKEIVDFLKAPKKYIQVGARIPKECCL